MTQTTLRRLLPLVAALLACPQAPIAHAQALTQPATAATAAANRRVLDVLPFADKADFDDAQRGFIATLPASEQLRTPQGTLAWDFGAYRFVQGAAPDSVNPSLWRQALVNNFAGLFKVTERVYQVRGFDIANMDIIEGDSGLIIIDPLLSTETARAGLELYYQHRPRKPVVAVIYSHSHADHFGGVKGVVDEADVRAGKVRIFAPAGFMEEAINENVVAGNAMNRRAQFMFGTPLAVGTQGHVDAGLGKAVASGTITLIAPTDAIAKPFEAHRVDGVDIEFQLTPETEAPAEMHVYFPQLRTLCIAENANHTQHNLLTPRGALVRDARKWAYQLDAARLRYGDRTDALIAQHTWPVWGSDRIKGFLADTRDMYAYLHDQTVRLMNKGYTPTQIADEIRSLPPGLANKWYLRGYYGTISFNVRAIYQRYLGFYDGNPAHLNPLPAVESARRTIEWMGGADAVLERARAAFDQGDYRWVAQVLNELVFAQPANAAAKALQARTLEQLGYQSESAVWRNIYLLGAQELRGGIAQRTQSTSSADIARAMSVDMLFAYMAIRVDAAKVEGQQALINWRFSDDGSRYAMTLRNGALTVLPEQQAGGADLTITLAKPVLIALSAGVLPLDKAVQDGKAKVEGDARKLQLLLGSLDTFRPNFPLVTPAVER